MRVPACNRYDPNTSKVSFIQPFLRLRLSQFGCELAKVTENSLCIIQYKFCFKRMASFQSLTTPYQQKALLILPFCNL